MRKQQSNKDKEILALFSIPSDPIFAQCLACPSAGKNDSWKLDVWHRVFVRHAEDESNFFTNVKKLRLNVDSLAKSAGFLPVLTTALPQTARTLVNARHLLLLSEMLDDTKHRLLSNLWEDEATSNRKICQMSGQEVWVPRAELNWFHVITRGIFGQASDWTLVRQVMDIPYRDKISNHPLGDEQVLVVSARVQSAVETLLADLRTLPESRKFLVSEERSSILQTEDQDTKMLTLHEIQHFLDAYLSPTRTTPAHVDVFLFFMRHYCTWARPFSVNLHQSNTKLKAVKIYLGDGTTNCNRVSECEKALLVEAHVLESLNRRYQEHEMRMQEYEQKCREVLKQGNRVTATMWLKKKKMLELENQRIDNQILKIEEGRQLRDSTKTIQTVEDALTSTVHATKSLRGFKEMDVERAMDDIREATEDIREHSEIFADSSLQYPEENDEVEKEFNTLLLEIQTPQENQTSINMTSSRPAVVSPPEITAQELEALLQDVPGHPLPARSLGRRVGL